MESQNTEYKQSWRDEYLKWIYLEIVTEHIRILLVTKGNTRKYTRNRKENPADYPRQSLCHKGRYGTADRKVKGGYWQIIKDVIGDGNKAAVSGNTTVNIKE